MIEALILGIVQGLTEFLPVSSTAHLVLFPWFFHWTGELDSLTFDVALHAGTLLALLVCFWRDWIELIFTRRRLFSLIVIASVPAGIAGFFLNDLVEHALRSPYVIAVSLVVFGCIMLIAEKLNKSRTMENITLADALTIGIAQAIAIIPGVSRSGITISAGLFRGIDRESSARFSFLLSTPVIAGATVLHARKLMNGNADHHVSLFVIGLIASAVTGFAALRFLMSFFRKHPLNAFAYYRFGLAAVIIAGLWLRK
ncbi:MAG: undecaprenyl-diphosphate phosphatase [Nitrospirae bacterium]|nr:undecaprenyl-diphosphate phosphatase [Nitrospirota bacterium]